MKHRSHILFALLLFQSIESTSELRAAPEADSIAVRLRKLPNAARVLMIGSHPDDEDSALLAELALRVGVRVWYLSLTRGEGGQNRIGDEKGLALGLVRTGELLAARSIDGAEQLLGPFVDFGFSKIPEEAFERWGRDRMVACIVQAIRYTRCDVVVSVWRGEKSDGHGHHQATGSVAIDAFELAKNSEAFPEQLRAGLEPWEPKRLVARYRPGRMQDSESSRWGALDIEVLVGRLDPVLQRSPHEVAMEGRSLHRSQDMGTLQSRGLHRVHYSIFGDRDDRAPGEYFSSVLEGLPVTLAEWVSSICGAGAPRGSLLRMTEYVGLMRSCVQQHSPESPGPTLERLEKGLELLRTEHASWTRFGGVCASAVLDRVENLLGQLESLWFDLAGVVVEPLVESVDVSPGESIAVDVQIARRGQGYLKLVSTHLSGVEGAELRWEEDPREMELPNDLGALGTVHLRLPVDSEPAVQASLPPWTLRTLVGDVYGFGDDIPDLRPRPSLIAVVGVTVESSSGLPVALEVPVVHRRVDPGYGELRQALRAIPEVTVEALPALHVLRRGTAKKAVTTLTVHSHGAGEKPEELLLARDVPGRPRTLHLPEGLEGEGVSLSFRHELEVDVSRPGETRWVAKWAGETGLGGVAHSIREVSYPHIEETYYLDPAEIRVVVVDCEVPEDLKVAYIPGTGDDVPAALAALDVEVEVLDGDALAFADLSGFECVVVGIRALEVREELLPHRERLWDYARGGGTLVVQYHKPRSDGASRFVPFEGAKMKRPAPRVTDETAEVTLLEPEDPLLSFPNKITAADFQGWVQERGLYFLEEWPEELVPLLGCHDRGEPSRRGGLLRGRLGQGHYVYCAYSLFRQLPAGVPGGYRLLANLVSLGRQR